MSFLCTLHPSSVSTLTYITHTIIMSFSPHPFFRHVHTVVFFLYVIYLFFQEKLDTLKENGEKVPNSSVEESQSIEENNIKDTHSKSSVFSSWVHHYNAKQTAGNHTVYDPHHRNPLYCGAEYSPLWELGYLKVCIYHKSRVVSKEFQYILCSLWSWMGDFIDSVWNLNCLEKFWVNLYKTLYLISSVLFTLQLHPSKLFPFPNSTLSFKYCCIPLFCLSVFPYNYFTLSVYRLTHLQRLSLFILHFCISSNANNKWHVSHM